MAHFASGKFLQTHTALHCSHRGRDPGRRPPHTQLGVCAPGSVCQVGAWARQLNLHTGNRTTAGVSCGAGADGPIVGDPIMLLPWLLPGVLGLQGEFGGPGRGESGKAECLQDCPSGAPRGGPERVFCTTGHV